MEQEVNPGVTFVAPASSSSKQRILECIAGNAAALLATLRVCVKRMGLASGEEVDTAAVEVLQQMVIEALVFWARPSRITR